MVHDSNPTFLSLDSLSTIRIKSFKVWICDPRFKTNPRFYETLIRFPQPYLKCKKSNKKKRFHTYSNHQDIGFINTNTNLQNVNLKIEYNFRRKIEIWKLFFYFSLFDFFSVFDLTCARNNCTLTSTYNSPNMKVLIAVLIHSNLSGNI